MSNSRPRYSTAYQRYVTLLLLSVYVFNQADRSVFSILMEPIKNELLLSDTQLGFLAGPALVVLYVTLGVPIAHFADRSHRVNIMTVAIGAWSSIVMLSAIVGSFWQLVLARVGVGIGEAGFSAIAQSVIADYHAPKERTQALSIFMLGIPLGSVVSYLMGGWVNQAFGWRLAFVVAGAPGIALCMLMNRTVKEPLISANRAGSNEGSSLRDALGSIWRQRALRHLLIAQAVLNTVLSCERVWLPAFLIRTQGLQTGRVGAWAALAEGAGGGFGIWLGGYLANRYGAADQSKQARVMAVATVLALPLVVIALWYPLFYFAMPFWLLSFVAMFLFLGPLFSLVQSLCVPATRATVASLFILVQVLCGSIFGVQVLGMVSDALAPLVGSGTALRWAMTAASVLIPWAALHFCLAARAIRDEVSLQIIPPT